MKYRVQYLQPKKRGYAKQNAVILWENAIKKQGAKEIIIVPA